MSTFKATLGQLIIVADYAAVDGYAFIENGEASGVYGEIERAGSVLDILLSYGEDTTLEFFNNEVEVVDGDACVLDTEGEEHYFAFRVQKPIRQEDVQAFLAVVSK